MNDLAGSDRGITRRAADEKSFLEAVRMGRQQHLLHHDVHRTRVIDRQMTGPEAVNARLYGTCAK